MPLPRDPCFNTNSCDQAPAEGARFGDGVTTSQLQTYWAENHPGTPFPAELGNAGVTRYDVYRYEIDNNQIPDLSSPPENSEDGNPTCSTATPVNEPDRDRRVLTTAVINCIEHGVTGQTPNVPVESFLQIFLTELIGFDGPSQDDIYGELIGEIEPGADDGILHEFPVLYR